MPILSTKPTKRTPKPGTPPKPTLADYASEAQITATGQAQRQVNGFNSKILSMTQPYSRAAELRAGQSYPEQLRQMRRRERGDDSFPPRRVGGVRGGRFLTGTVD